MLLDDTEALSGLSWNKLKLIHVRMSMVTDAEEMWEDGTERKWLEDEHGVADDAPEEVKANYA